MKPTSKRHKPKPRVPRAIKEEAEGIHRAAVYQHPLARPLVWRFARKIKDSITRGNAQLDFNMIVHYLIPGDPETRDLVDQGPTKAIWQRYRHHFQGRKARQQFFSAIDVFARRYLGDILYACASSTLDDSTFQPPDLLWDYSLLPTKAAPHLLRQWTRDNKLTREFMVALFKHFKRDAQEGSPGRRALLVSQNAPVIGFKPAAHTKRLIETGDINLGQHQYPAGRKEAFDRQAATTGRAIRRLRREAKNAPPPRHAPKKRPP